MRYAVLMTMRAGTVTASRRTISVRVADCVAAVVFMDSPKKFATNDATLHEFNFLQFVVSRVIRGEKKRGKKSVVAQLRFAVSHHRNTKPSPDRHAQLNGALLDAGGDCGAGVFCVT